MNLPRTKYASVLATLTVAYLLCPMSPADADDVINDDLIVIGSTSIGFDSVNGETFGFDTLKLKENNTRLTFLDTSVIGNFPRRDWRIRANEATNGGRNAFFIDDMGNNFTDGTENAQVGTPFTIEAGAPTNAIVIDNIGRLGIR